ncbi:MAG TPA: type IV secretory system conjugative DNA transfer family protein [Longilinea sp.]|nr:type IV secretory system conjugative DNA transfer family protein [Longilinea sp.]
MNINFGLIKHILWGKLPPVRVWDSQDELFPEGLTMGTLIIGRQGTGKTSSLARQIVDYFISHPNEAVFVLDWSGSITDTILMLIHQRPPDVREKTVKRIIYDELGNREWVVPFPEFSLEFGSFEEQAQRVSTNLAKLAPALISNAPILGGLGLREIAPQIFRLLTAIDNEYYETWQITEAKKLLIDENLLKVAVNRFGYKVPEAKYFIEKIFLPLKPSERELRSYALLSLLGTIEPKEARARVGYYRPGWTPREAIDKGMMVIVNGANMINQRNSQHYLFTQVYSVIMQEVNKRTPGNPEDKPVSLVMDEVYSLIGIPSMAEEIGMISPLYRSRKLQLFVVLQSLSQLAKPLDDQIWSLGNKVVFALENKDEAEKVAHQLFKYDPRYLKQAARINSQNPITEPEHGQDRLIADWIQSFGFRECLMRRYVSEREPEGIIRYVSRTRENPNWTVNLSEIKEGLLQARAIRVREALEIINNRSLNNDRSRRPPTI